MLDCISQIQKFSILFWFDMLKIMTFVFVSISHWIIICDIDISDNLETVLLGIKLSRRLVRYFTAFDVCSEFQILI
jgi:hypothetical protein